MVRRHIAKAMDCPVVVAYSKAEAAGLLEAGEIDPLAAVVDLELPDAPGGLVVDAMIAAGVPTIVLTGSCDAETRERILDKQIVDYFVKEEQGVEGVIEMLRRLQINPTTKILIVDDSRTFRMLVRRLLEVHRFTIIEAEDGLAGLRAIEEHPEISLVLTDFEMPNMNGVEFVSKLRAARDHGELAVIGISAQGNSSMSAMFLKFGADDFLTKPFEKEEFYCRVYRSIETVEHIREIRRTAFTDQLTGLSNRLHFFQTAPSLYEEAVLNELPLTTAMIDIDHFKNINDTYGHAGGDVALQDLAELLTSQLDGMDVVARFGGEEFCVFSVGLSPEQAVAALESLRLAVEAHTVRFDEQEIRFTLSIGATFEPGLSLDRAINQADALLYQAKESGRNRLVTVPIDAN